jgi:hypothetical protein
VSTSDALTASTARLSLSSQPDYTAPFSLISSDGERSEVDALTLASAAKVFRDMLSSGEGDRECKLSEGKDEVERFLKAIEKGEVPAAKEALDSLRQMGDKYNAGLRRCSRRSARPVRSRFVSLAA